MKKQKMSAEELAVYKTTDEYKYKRAKKWKILSLCEEWISILSPFCIMLAVRWNEWIKTDNDKYSIASGLVLAFIMTAFAIYRKFKSEMKLGYLFMIVGWWMTALCLMFLNNLVADIVEIMIYTGVGLLVSIAGKFGEGYYSQVIKKYDPKTEKTEKAKFRNEAFRNLFTPRKEHERKDEEI